MFTCGAMTLFPTVDGEKLKKQKLGNGQTISFEIDEREHRIHMGGGALSGKSFSDEILIPAGNFSYQLRVEFPYAGNANHPRISAMGEDVFEKSNMGQFLGSSVTKFLLLPEVRQKIAGQQGLRLQFVAAQDCWEIHVLLPTGQDIVMYKGNYLQVTGSGLGTISFGIEKMVLDDPAKRKEMERKLILGYIAGLSDYMVLQDLTFVPRF